MDRNTDIKVFKIAVNFENSGIDFVSTLLDFKISTRFILLGAGEEHVETPITNKVLIPRLP